MSCRWKSAVRRLVAIVAIVGGVSLAAAATAPASANELRTVGPLLSSQSRQVVHLNLVALHAQRGQSRHAASFAPTITLQPANALVAPGSYARFTAKASGRPRPRVQWQLSVNGGRKWRAIAGAHATSFSFMARAGQSGDEFRATFLNRRGRSATAPAMLSVIAGESAPLVVNQPMSQTAAAGATVSFDATASGQPAPSVQWEISDNGGASWSDVAGATQPTLAFTASSILNGDEFRAAFTNALGSVLSNVATLTVSGTITGPPVVTEQPQDTSVRDGQTATFTATATGNPAPSIQWEVSTGHGSWQAISGATSNTYSFVAGTTDNLSEYEAVFTSSAGTVTSEPAILAVDYAMAENWSGYAATGTTYSAVTASWHVPSLTCPSGQANTFSSQWVGIDGVNDATVEQDGTEADCTGATASYGAWYEMFGDSAVSGGAAVPIASGCTGLASCHVGVGDLITATVTAAGNGSWTLSMNDATSPDVWKFTTTISAPTTAPTRSSAEWIVERPEVCTGHNQCGITPLADFGTVQFTNATATTTNVAQSIGELGGEPIEMVSSSTDSTLLALPGQPSGSGFTDAWFASS